MNKRVEIALVVFLITGSLFFIFYGLVYGKGFLIPLVTAIIFSMIILPIAKKLKSWGLNKGLSIFLADMSVLLFIAGIVFVLIAQGSNIAKNWDQIEKNMKTKIEQLKSFYNNTLSIKQSNKSEQENQAGQNSKEQQKKHPVDSILGNMQDKIMGLAKNAFSILTDLLLILVYIFFFLYYREKFKGAIIRMVPENQKQKAQDIISDSSKESQRYMLGRFILIVILAIMYMIGFSLAGLQNAIFISIFAAVLSLIPYVGNIIAIVLAGGMAFMTGGSTTQLLIIGIIFAVIQFIESYMLEPFVVGKKVDLNPVIVIVGIVLGGVVWGVMGMILSLPILAILKVIFDNVEPLEPLGYALDERDIQGESKIVQKIKGIFKK